MKVHEDHVHLILSVKTQWYIKSFCPTLQLHLFFYSCLSRNKLFFVHIVEVIYGQCQELCIRK